MTIVGAKVSVVPRGRPLALKVLYQGKPVNLDDVNVGSENTLLELRTAISIKTGVALTSLRLMHKGTLLRQDTLTLQQNKIQTGAKIMMVAGT